MFDLHNFVKRTLQDMILAGESAYKVRQFALSWYDKAHLTDDDMAELDIDIGTTAEPEVTLSQRLTDVEDALIELADIISEVV